MFSLKTDTYFGSTGVFYMTPVLLRPHEATDHFYQFIFYCLLADMTKYHCNNLLKLKMKKNVCVYCGFIWCIMVLQMPIFYQFSSLYFKVTEEQQTFPAGLQVQLSLFLPQMRETWWILVMDLKDTVWRLGHNVAAALTHLYKPVI